MDKSIHETVGNVMEYRSYQRFKQLAGKLIVQAEFYFTGSWAQTDELPATIKVPEWTILQ